MTPNQGIEKCFPRDDCLTWLHRAWAFTREEREKKAAGGEEGFLQLWFVDT